MTTPVQHGYPDWGRSISASDIQVIGVAQNITQVTSNLGRFFVGNLPYLFVVLFSDLQGANLQFDWYTASTGANLVGTRTVDVLAGGDAAGALTNMGPYVEITLRLVAQPSNVIVRVFQTLYPATHHTSISGPNLFAIDTLNVGAGVTNTATSSVVRWGLGHWFADFEAGVVYRHSLYAVDYTGATRLIDIITNGGRRGPGLILLPPQPMRLVSLNGDGVARNLWASVNSASVPLT